MITKNFNGEKYELDILVSFGLYNNCSYDDLHEAMKEAIGYMKDSDEDTEVKITLRWF